MIRRLLAVCTLMLVLFTAPVLAANAVIENAIDRFVRPAYSRLHQSAESLAGGMAALCSAPSDATLAKARRHFVDAVRSWSEVEIIRFGPITEDNRLEKMLFWPDRKGIGLRQVQAALAVKDPTAADVGRLAGKSVAMQGFGALEFVMFGTGAEKLAVPAEAYRCAYGQAIAANIESMTKGVLDDWMAADGFARIWSEPGKDNPTYHTNDEALTELLDTLVHGLEMTRDVRINGFLGETADDDRPKQAIFWRSEATIESLSANIRGMRGLLEASQLVNGLPANDIWIADSMRFEFDNVEKALRGLSGPIGEALGDRKRRGRLAYARVVTSSLSEIVGARLAAAFNLTAGFSSLDGD